MLRKIKLIGQLLLLQLTAKSQAVPFDQLPFVNPLLTDVDSMIHEQVKVFFTKSKAPGVIIGISQHGEKKYYSYGFADPATKKEFHSKTIFEAGSITKTFVANIIVQSSQQGIIDLTRPISAYLPLPGKNDSVLNKIILKDILSHLGGLPRLPADLDKIKEYTLMQPYAFYNRNYLYPYLQTLKKSDPGKYAYSNLGFGLLGTILENVSATSLESLLNKYILQPLAMDHSYLDAIKKPSDSATGFLFEKPAEYWRFDCLAGAGALKSTAADMLKYLDAHYGSANEKFSAAVNTLIQPVKYAGPGTQICYGWHTMDDLKHRVYWHNGGTYGFSTFASFEPETKTSVVLASNSSQVNQPLEKLAKDLLILLMGK